MRTDGICPPRKFLVFGAVLAAACLLEAWPRGISPSAPPALGAERRPPRQSFSAEERAHWSFQAVHRPPVPRARAANRVETPVDAFVLAKLEERGLGFSPPCDRRDLMRRVTFDLLGLPPTPIEVDAFVADPAPDAYERLIDRLLSSPHYGESWGRMWLDLVRFAETAGYKADPLRPLAWKYRDFVVRAFNTNVPYDRFVQEQIAGDELFPDDVDAQIATGYLRMWPDESNASIVALARQDALNDLTGNVGSAFLGLSIGCAQCHDHKFDPIKQHDFYRLEAFFAGIAPVEKVAVGSAGAIAEYHRQVADWEKRTRAVRDDLFHVLSTARARAAAERRKRFPPEVLAAIDKPPEQRTPLERQFFFWSDRQIEVSEKQILAQMSAADRARLPKLRQHVAKLEASRPKPPRSADAMATVEFGGPVPATFLNAGGSYDKPVREVQPGFLSVLFRESEPLAKIAPPREGVVGRRAALARWLTDPHNPLVPRVIVNRIWQGHMGRGLVENANDLGTQTPPPSHPELLDWLASEFVASGWDVKALHRLILTSSVYRQAGDRRRGTDPPAVAAKIDAENSLYWHANRRRLRAEEVRDANLVVSGRLSEKMGGSGIRPTLPAALRQDGWKVTASPVERDRRSVYIFAKRNLPFPLLKDFDLPDMHESCARRSATIIAPQALALFNGEFVVGCADSLARRILADPRLTDWSARTVEAYRIVFGRPLGADEQADAMAFLRTQAGHLLPERELHADAGAHHESDAALRTAFADFCHTLLNANEFLFLD
ncbi:MAG TPA: DUF1549 and DUF1553 domain-containing protein [Planctomycetaceae bacterium]|jgi:hypothetical protein|nr:DUF1549 and DUF1553 domain-containing protein [Planctomycetaceae bacterium]